MTSSAKFDSSSGGIFSIIYYWWQAYFVTDGYSTQEVPPDGSRHPATPLSLLEPLNIDFMISGNYSRIKNSEIFEIQKFSKIREFLIE